MKLPLRPGAHYRPRPSSVNFAPPDGYHPPATRTGQPPAHAQTHTARTGAIATRRGDCMRQASEHASASTTTAPSQTTTVRPEAPLPPCSAPTVGYPFPRRRAQEDCVHHSEEHPHPLSLPRATQQPGTARHAIWGGTRLSRPYLTALRPSGTQNRAHANKPTPEREHASKQTGQRGGRSHTAPPPQASAPTPRKRKHPKRTQQ